MFVFILVCLVVAMIIGAVFGVLEYRFKHHGSLAISGVFLSWFFYILGVICKFGEGNGHLQGMIVVAYAFGFGIVCFNLWQLDRQRAKGFIAARAR